MESFCFEIKSTCKSCGNPLAINALANDIYCDACNFKNTISEDIWKSILSDNIKEARSFKEGEGQNSKTFTGEFEFSLLYGKQKARCVKCKTTIPENIFDSFSGNEYTCVKCNNIISIRKPDDFISKIIPAATFVAGEDINQFNTHVNGIKKPENIKPILFNCPSCAANLEVDGSNRMITCKFCNSKIYLPDDLWHELHPVKTVERWYVLTDDKNVKGNFLPEFYHLSDVAVDYDGNLFIAGADSESEQFILWSITSDAKLRWIRNDIKFEYENSGITVTKDNKVYLWNPNKRSLSIFSSKDGSDLPSIKGIDATEENPFTFNLKDCHTLLSDTDNTILAVVNNTFVRFNNDGTRASLWNIEMNKNEEPGFFAKLFGGDDKHIKIQNKEDDYPPTLKELGNKPKRTAGEYIKMNTGFDGFIYILDTSSYEGMIAKYSRDGKQIWKKNVPLTQRDCKPFADRNGNVYVLGVEKDERRQLIKFSPDGDKIDVILDDILEGGKLSTEDTLGVAPDGTIYVLCYYEVLKIFAPDLTLKYISDRAKEEDNDKIEEYKEKQEKEE